MTRSQPGERQLNVTSDLSPQPEPPFSPRSPLGSSCVPVPGQPVSAWSDNFLGDAGAHPSVTPSLAGLKVPSCILHKSAVSAQVVGRLRFSQDEYQASPGRSPSLPGCLAVTPVPGLPEDGQTEWGSSPSRCSMLSHSPQHLSISSCLRSCGGGRVLGTAARLARLPAPASTQDSRRLPEAPSWAVLASGQQQGTRPPASGVVAEFCVGEAPKHLRFVTIFFIIPTCIMRLGASGGQIRGLW